MPEQLERYEQKPLSEQTKQNLMDQLTLADHLVYKKYLPDLQNYALVDPTEQMVGGKITDDYMKVFKLEELTVKQGEDQLQKLSTVYHSSMALGCSLAVLVSVKKSGAPASIYLGVRRNLRQKNSEAIENLDISFKTLHEGMKSNFPGSQTNRIYASDDQQDTESLNYLLDGAFGDKMRTITSASCVAALRDKSKTENKAFIQGIERFMDAMGDHVYTALFLADPVSENDQASIRSSYEQLYSTLSPFRKSTWSYNENHSNAVMSSVCDGKSNVITDGTSASSSKSRGSDMGFSLNLGIEKGHTENLEKSHQKGIFEREKPAAPQDATSGAGRAVAEEKKINWKKTGVIAAGVVVAAGTAALCVFQPELAAAAAAKAGPILTKAASAVGLAKGAAIEKKNLFDGRDTISHGAADMLIHTMGCGLSHNISRSSNEETGESHNEAKGTVRNETSGNTKTDGNGTTLQIEFDNKSIENLLERIDEQLQRTRESEDYGCYNCSAYFLAPQAQTAILAANTYRALMIGEGSAVESGAVNIWQEQKYVVPAMREYLKHFEHPVFMRQLREDGDVSLLYTPGTMVSGRELPMHLGLPTRSVHGMAVIEHAEFGRYVPIVSADKKEQLALGCIYHMGNEEKENKVFLQKQALRSHTFITGSTGSGKSNAVYQLLAEVTKDSDTTFLVVEPAKGEYKHIFGNGKAKVYGTNENLTPLLRINPFTFPPEIHVREHIDRLVEIFNACWPMYAAMPAILKDAVERCYRNTGWDLRRSVNVQMTYPTFYDLMDILPSVIQESEYSKDTQSDYTGALYTRVRSLTTGIYGNILCAEDGLEDAELFDCNVIVDLSRVTSMETKSLLMGLLVIKLQEYRMCTSEMNQPLRHITVLEEAHNLLRRTSDVQAQESANLQGKSVEMLTDAIAEMRTYGEGFVIADQSPGLLDPAVIRNTNTKMILRLPSEEDRKLVGKSAGLNDKQIEELAKLEMGVAAVYQNEWNEPILCKVNYYPEPENCYQKPCSMEMDSDTELVMRELLSEKEESELPKEVLEHWWKHWQNRIDTTTGQYLCEVLENQNDKCDEVIQKAVYDIFEGKQLFGWYGNKMESRTDAYGELIERLCGRYRLSEKIAKEILDCIMTTGLEEAKNKEGVEAIRKKYNEQRSEQV